ncbi:4'-phosphopantetheinyl transferase superfamily protein [Kitasatospora sp. NBC_01287]|uniref:holo-ACP synthase n=1 Tax=Kitasatospora sp. NBC_01287 TaxID=2903573 RepID=UPI00224D8EB7|nr:4'-phosphopantetheinyl transferase superfamily protein [Kitasatospora sp. NBC_01287]MCX4747532.1 4'-phosphopantetheinyl transferase superfamily protein [Kitasatospora sp. NBC_01287]
MAGSRRELIGLGHDLQLVSEVAAAAALSAPEVFFTAAELRHFAASAVPPQSLAGGFAAKEALFKALPPTARPWFWTDAELVHDGRGAPGFRLRGALADELAHRRPQVSVSLSHSGGFVSAVVLVTGTAGRANRFRNTIDRAVRHVLRRNTADPAGAPQ